MVHLHLANTIEFRKKNHIEAIGLDEINELMNEIWDGPGSMNKLATLTSEMRTARLWDIEEEK